MSVGQTFVKVCATGFILAGVSYLFAPALLAGLAEITVDTGASRTDVRATYGGFQIGAGLFMWWCASVPQRTTVALMSLGILTGGVGACRLIGLLLDGGLLYFNLVGLAFEIPVAALALWSAQQTPAE